MRISFISRLMKAPLKERKPYRRCSYNALCPGCPERGGRDRQTDRKKDRDRQTDRQTDRRGPGGAVCLRRRRHVPKCGLDMPRRSVMPTPSTHLPLLLSVKRQIFCVGKG